MFFVVFDLEAVFLFAWAGAARELGWTGYCEVLVFVGALLAALIYIAKVGALDWARDPPRSRGKATAVVANYTRPDGVGGNPGLRNAVTHGAPQRMPPAVAASGERGRQ